MIRYRLSKLPMLLSIFVLMSSTGLAADPIRIACVGDSITYGAGIKDRENDNYPVQLGRLLGDGYVAARSHHRDRAGAFRLRYRIRTRARQVGYPGPRSC